MEQFLNQIEVLNYKIDGADEIGGIGSIPISMIGGESSPLLPVTIVGSVGANGICNVFLAVPTLFNGHTDCYIEGPHPTTNSINIYLENYPEVGILDMSMIGTSPSLNSIFNTVDVFITTSSDTVFSKEGGIDVTLIAPQSGLAEQGVDVTVLNLADKPNKTVDITLWCEYLAAVRALKMHIAGDGLYDGYIPYGGGMNCHIERLPRREDRYVSSGSGGHNNRCD
jgi:hypothetical protein